MQIAVIGPNTEASDQDLADAAYIGREIARRGAVLLTGGLGGVMRAATDGAVGVGGTAVSLAPGAHHQNSLEQNPGATVVIPTGIGQMRNVLLVRSAHAVISVGCNWGTLTEIGLAPRDGKPTVCLRPWPIDTGAVRARRPTTVTTAEAAVEAAFRELASGA
ncbi:dethiobiotin synthetase [Actinoplanes sp. NPDC049596]|uniref:SLOG cluster 4 domain-containing protein n=1 Tax=unclassified Actinoplanes TaxID=2626549 RepID=UPI0034409B4D